MINHTDNNKLNSSDFALTIFYSRLPRLNHTEAMPMDLKIVRWHASYVYDVTIRSNVHHSIASFHYLYLYLLFMGIDHLITLRYLLI